MSLQPADAADKSAKWTSQEPWSQLKHTPGAFPPSPNASVEKHLAEHSSIAEAVKARRREYTCKKKVRIKVGSWNVAAVSGAEKDLAGWFVKGFGAKGLSQELSDLSLVDATASDSSSEDESHIESVEEQESRVKKGKTTLPKHDVSAVASEDEVGIYALGLQEVIDITSVTEAFRPYYDHNPGKKWKHALKKSLPAGYTKVAELQLLGLLILIYAAPSVASFITSVDAVSVGTGALGYMGNKGATSVRIVLGGFTRILFVNCHLAAGADKQALERRIWDTQQILSRTKFSPANYDGDSAIDVHEEIGHEDVAFWFGDLNYRLDGIPGEDVRRLLLLHTRNEYDILNKSKRRIDSELGYRDASASDLDLVNQTRYESGETERPATHSSAEPQLDPKDDPASLYTTIQALLAHDQLRIQQKLGKAFHEGWREGDIKFLPTYKYDVGSVGMFDSGEKKRSPSWCDRILYRTRRDKLAYDQRAAQELESRKKDERMKAQGIDKEAVLYDYDPETDGADEDDEYNDAETTAETADSAEVQEMFDDPINLEDYISHQRVLSSDHKPLSAVFVLNYEAVDVDMKTKIHGEVTRDYDKLENDSRPSITIVVENHPESSAVADRPAGSTELSDVVFEPVKYDVPQVRTLTIANTSLIPTTFAFIDRPLEEDNGTTLAPSWLTVHVNKDSQVGLAKQDDLGSATPFLLEPGDIATVDLTVKVSDFNLARKLNQGSLKLDDILVLRVLNGRDHFVRVTGTWLPTCFGRTLDELVKLPDGVRKVVQHGSDGKDTTARAVDSASHSAPRELFMLTEVLPATLQRAIADWTMVHVGEDGPWLLDPGWPFSGHGNETSQSTEYNSGSAAVRDALDTATPIEDRLDIALSPLERVQILSDVFVDFISSLQDGIIPAQSWTTIEQKLIDMEKSKADSNMQNVQDMVIDVLSAAPVHSVSFTFITFMLTRMLTELSAEAADAMLSPQSPPTHSRDRSSTQTSEVCSEISIDSSVSVTSPRSRFAMLSPFSRRQSALGSGQSTPTTPQTPFDRRARHTVQYVERLAPIVIRAEQDGLLKGKDAKVLNARKRKVLEAFLVANQV